TKDDGSFLLVLPSAVNAITLRVRKNGLRYLTLNVTVGIPDVRITLSPLQSAALNGSYTVTITADSACTQIPEKLRARTYRATIGSQSDVVFSVALAGAD